MAPAPGRRANAGRAAAGAAGGLLLVLLLANACGFLLQPLSDPDFFWHLKTGEWIREHGALPGTFLFAVPPPLDQPESQHFTMTSSWLAQAALAALHAAGGFAAIVAWRFLLFLALLLLLARRLRGGALMRLGLLSLIVPVLGQYPPERPQFLSFVFAATLLLLLEGLREADSPAGARRWAIAVPPLMLLWANCHGGFIVGIGILGLFTLCEALKRSGARLEPLPAERLRLLLAATAGGALASLANPNGWAAFRIASGPASGFIREYRSTIEGFRWFAEPWIVVYWLLLALAVIGLGLSWRRPNLTTVCFVLLTAYFSFTRIRFIPFFVVTALPMAAAALADPRFRRAAQAVAVALGLGAGAFFLPDTLRTLAHARRSVEINDFMFPVAAADFVDQEHLQGDLFNYYDWGGYLLWRLAPRRVFIDGRNASPQQLETYRRVLAGDRRLVQGGEFWKTSLRQFDVHLTITPFFNPLSGRLPGLIDVLLADPAWVPVYASPTTVIFAEDVPQNRDVVLRRGLAKQDFLAALLEATAQLIADRPAFVLPYVARGELLLRLDDRAAAMRSFEAALRVDPAQPAARKWLAQLRGGETAQPDPKR
jgi:hypothetical protein